MSNKVPEKIINFAAYLEGKTFLGTVDATLPSLESLTETVSGAGIAGEIESPTLGHYGSMTISLNWRTATKEAVVLHAPKSHTIDFFAAQQVYDSGAGSYSQSGLKVTVKAIPKTGDLGTLAPNAQSSTTNELEVTYIKIVVDGKTLVEIDKFNFKAVIDGVDYLEQVRNNLGM